MATDKKSFNIRISPEAQRLLDEVAKKLGVSKASVFELAIRKIAEQENVR